MLDKLLSDYENQFISNDLFWYFSKAISITPNEISKMAKRLSLFEDLFVTDKFAVEYNKFKSNSQAELELQSRKPILFDRISQLFIFFQAEKQQLWTSRRIAEINVESSRKRDLLISDFSNGENYEFLEEKFGGRFLGDVAANVRNSKSWLEKFGFLYTDVGTPPNILLTECGEQFIDLKDQQDECFSIFQQQCKKIQFWNPNFETVAKYKPIQVRTYRVILKLLLDLPENYFTEEEYILFISRTRNEKPETLKQIIKLINSFRKLTQNEIEDYIESIKTKDMKQFPQRRRTVYSEIKDSAWSKALKVYCPGSTIIRNDSEKKISLQNKSEAEQELSKLNQKDNEISNSYFFSNQTYELSEWNKYFGSKDGLSNEEMASMYVNNENYDRSELLEIYKDDSNLKLVEDKLYEKDIENYYVDHLNKIDPNLEIYNQDKPIESGQNGQQYRTAIGIIDLLCFDKEENRFVVIEFKRDQSDDDTLGQILRYMGFVAMDLVQDTEVEVHGIIAASKFSNKLDYAIFGVQENNFLDKIVRFKHPFTRENPPPEKLPGN